MILKIILYIFIAICIAVGLYEMYVDNEKKVAYVAFIFAILTFVFTLIPTKGEEPKNPEDTTTKVHTNVEFEHTENTDYQLTENLIATNTQTSGSILSNIEIEPNDKIETSNIIQANKQYQGRLKSSEDVDYYKIKIESSGKISISFQHDKIDSGNRLWEVRLIDGQTDKEIIRHDSVGGVAKDESYRARISAGEYYIKINSYYHSDKNYSFKVNFYEESDSYEKETNDQIEVANKINVNEYFIGNLQTDKDVDYFKINIKNKGKINFSFEHEKIDSGNRLWEVYLLDGINDSIIISLFSTGREAALDSDFARIPPGEYYIKIKPYHYSNDDYKLKINFENEFNSYESENNNAFSSANAIEIGQEYTGNIQNENDVDYYCFTVTQTQDLTLLFSHWLLESNNCYWEIYLVDGNNDNNITSLRVNGSSGSASSLVENISPGEYYIKVKSYHFNNTDYTISVY